MDHTKKQTVIEETTVSEPDNSPSVVAYRVGKLEEAVTKGFAEAAATIKENTERQSAQIKENGDRQAAQIKEIVDGFVTEKEMIIAKADANAEHERIWKELDRIKSWGVWVVRLIGGTLILALLVLLGLKIGVVK